MTIIPSLAALMVSTPVLAAPAIATVPDAVAPADATEASAAPLPDGVRAMIEAAIASGDAKAVETMLRFARATHPDAAAAIDAIEAPYRAAIAEAQAEEARARELRLAEAGPFDNWTGQVELGASRSTGNTNNLGLYGALDLTRDGLRWRHKLGARADVQETNGITTTKRVQSSWQPNYKFGERAYVYGLAQYEYDPLLGYENRYTAAGGVGFGVLKGERAKLDFEGGPAFRYTETADDGTNSSLAARASLNFRWKITPTLELKQTGAFYREPGTSSANALTVLDTKLLGSLKARFSYNVLYEGKAPVGKQPVDTLSRATLVYSF